MVKEAKQLSTHEPYVKLYLSKDGKDIKDTKQKTKPQKKTVDPIYEERFQYQLPAKTTLDDAHRLQVTVWDHGNLKSECMGGTSFTLKELSATVLGVRGWFLLLPEVDGRTRNVPVSDADIGADGGSLAGRDKSGSVSGSTSKRLSVAPTKAKGDDGSDDDHDPTGSSDALSKGI
jgi:hypothetical protein